MRGDLVRRFMVGQSLAIADTGGVGDVSLNVPIDVTKGLGIQIWGIDVERSVAELADDDTHYFTIIMSRSTVTADMKINNADVVWKMKVKLKWASAVGWAELPLVFHEEFYPAIPYFGSQLHVGIIHDSGAAVDCYVKVSYSTVQLDRNEMMAMIANQQML